MLQSLNLTDLTGEFYSMIRGALLMLTIYHLIIYFIYHSKIYLYYALFLFFFYVFLLSHIFDNTTPNLFYYLDRSFQLISLSFYFKLTREVLQTKLLYPIWDKILKRVTKRLFQISIVLIFITYFISKDAQTLVFFGTIIASIITISNFYMIKQKSLMYIKVFIIGSLTLLILLLITLLIYVFKFDSFFIEKGLHRMFFLYVGLILEFLLFAYLISIRYRENLNEKAQLDLAISRAKIEINEFKMMTLKSQLNPLFLFNTLNSINNLVLKSQIEEASDFITKFARFIRNILNNSNKTTISLHDELVNLKIYITLEKIRSNNSFEYLEEIEEGLNLFTIKVPPLFLQPFVENSIWHGLANKKGDNKVRIVINSTDKIITFNIIDNGIGINKSKELNKLKLTKSVSGATKSAIFRINKVFNRKNIDLKFIDLTNENESGTRVQISFPLIN